MRDSVFVCSGCGKLIFEGEPATHLLGEQWCVQCPFFLSFYFLKIPKNADPLPLIEAYTAPWA